MNGKILALFFLSGATSLVYEVVWMRRLSLVFGHSIFSVSTVLTVFMSGLALGSYLAGRWSDGRRKAGQPPEFFVKTYGRLELFIGLWGLLSLLLLNGVESGFLSMAKAGVGQEVLRGLIFLSAFLVLLPPTTAMGATLPVFTQALVLQRSDTGSRLSQIYGLNTLGACLGAAFGGLVCLPTLGLIKTVVLTAVGNLIIAALAYSLSRSTGPSASNSTPEGADEEETRGSLWVPLVFGLSGFAGMVYQLAWTRALVLSIGSSTYAFSIILTTFLAALGLGSIVYKALFRTTAPQVSHFAFLQITIALSATLVTLLMGALPALKLKIVPAMGHSFAAVAALDTVIVFLVLLVPALGLGLTFPLVTHLYTSQLSQLGRRLGEAYSANTCGAILGSFLGGFALIPLLGLQGTIRLAVGANLLGGLALLVTQSQAQTARKNAIVLTALTLSLAIFSPQWNLAMMSAGAGIGLNKGWLEPEPIFYRDGVTSTVTVKLNQGLYPYIQVNGKTDASFSPVDRRTQLLLGLIPAALHPNPKEVAVIGFGSGQTPVGLLSVAGVESLLCAELEPAVMEAQKFFAPFSEGLLEDQRLTIVKDDGRSFILGSPKQFDLIVSEPSNPWIAGIGNLYTEDFYQGCKQQLKPGGLMCQWFHFYSLSEEEIQLVYRTFFRVFPEGAVYRTSDVDLLLVGSDTATSMSLERVSQLYGEDGTSAFWLQSLGLSHPSMMFATFLATRGQVVSYLDTIQPGFENGPINTDDLPLLEFQAPLNLFAKDLAEGAYSAFEGLVPPAQAKQASLLLGATLGRLALGFPLDKKRALEQLQASQGPWHEDLIEPLLAGTPEPSLSTVAKSSQEWWLRRFWADRKDQLGEIEGLTETYSWLVARAPAGARYHLLMSEARQAAKEGRLPFARERYAEAAKLTSSDTPHVQSAILGEPHEWSEEGLRKAISIYPYSARTHHFLAIYLAQQERTQEALDSALESHRLFQNQAGVIRLITELYRKLSNADKVLEYQEKLRRLSEEQAKVGQPAQ